MTIDIEFYKNKLHTLLIQVLVYLQGFFVVPLVIKTSGIEMYGQYVILITALSFVFGLSSLGINYRMMRYLPSSEGVESTQEIFFPQFYVHAILIFFASILVVLILLFNNLFNFLKINEYSILLVFLYMYSRFLYSQSVDYFRFTNRIKIFNYATLSQPYMYILLVYLVYAYSGEVLLYDLIVAIVSSSIFVGVLLLRMIFLEIGIRFSKFNWKKLVASARNGFPLIINYMVEQLLAFSDKYIIAGYLGVLSVGIYSPAYSLGAFVLFFPRVIIVVLLPILVKLEDLNDKSKFDELVYVSLKTFLVICIGYITMIIIFGKDILLHYTNAEASEGGYLVLCVVSVSSLFLGVTLILTNILFVKFKTNLILKANLIALGVNFLLNMILMYFIRDILVAAITTVISYFLSLIYISRFFREEYSIRFPFLDLVKLLLIAILIGVLQLLIGDSGLALGELLLHFVVFVVIYAIFVFSFKVYDFKETMCLVMKIVK